MQLKMLLFKTVVFILIQVMVKVCLISDNCFSCYAMVVNVYQLDAKSEYVQFYMHLVWALLNPINCRTFEPGAAHNVSA